MSASPFDRSTSRSLNTKLDSQVGKTRLKGLEQGRPSQAFADCRATGQANHAGEHLVAGCRVTFARGHRLLDPLRIGKQARANFSEPIAGQVALNELAAQVLFERGEPTTHGRWFAPCALRRRQHAAGAGEGQKVFQVIPGQHAASLQFCEPEFAIFRLPEPLAQE